MRRITEQLLPFVVDNSLSSGRFPTAQRRLALHEKPEQLADGATYPD